jgi:hypothetical protein
LGVDGQNIPADWNDATEDKRVHAKKFRFDLAQKKPGCL